MDEGDLALRNRDGNTALCLAAIAGNAGMAKIMVWKNRGLPKIRGRDNMLPLHLAAFYGNRDMVTYLYAQSGIMNDIEHWTNAKRDVILLKCIQAGILGSSPVWIPDKEIGEDREEVKALKRESL
ncbi:hypothetical protein L1987_16040 [Smallanthus sonchifolius]|uniref:Uncharacterized protein n=1 Tax=Smallanthus sonchifolius TaxID=185202 RepID=A0ACB9J893_9ASTR|nr:hypothetical protein L1987_16040 [Smallanthus sonchifolius]